MLLLGTLKYLLTRWVSIAWLARPIAPWVRWLWPNFMPPVQCQLIGVWQRTHSAFCRDAQLCSKLQRQWNNAVVEFDQPLDRPIIVEWRAHSQTYRTYFQECLHFPPSLVRPRGASLWGGPRGDHYAGKPWETPSWIRANPPELA